MNSIHDFENRGDSDKTLKLVRKLKPIKERKRKTDLKVTGKITQVIGPNEFIIKTKLGKYYPVVTDKKLSVIFDYYDTTLVIVNDGDEKEYSLDIKYDVTVILGEVTDFHIGNETREKVARKLAYFWGLER